MTADVTHALPGVRGPQLLLTAAMALILAVGMLAIAGPTASAAGQAPALGAAANFAALAGTAVTCTGATVTGNVGVSPGTAITQTSCPVTGTIDAADLVAAQAQSDFVVAYNKLATLPCDQALTGLGSLTLSPGVYCFDAAATQTGGVLTLSGSSNGIWIFKIGTLGTGALTGTNFSVVMASGGQASNVYWHVAQAATMTDSTFLGTILAGAGITMTRGTFDGRALANAAVTITGTAVTGFAPATPTPTWSVLLSDDLLQAIAADNALFASLDPSLTDPTVQKVGTTLLSATGTQTISVSFFAGHIGPVSPSGSAHWTNTESNDSDSYSVEINIPAGGTPADGYSSFAGINFHHLPAAPPANPPAFDFKADRSAASGGSPRLVIVFSDHGNINLRPLAWVQDTWTSEGTGNPTPDSSFATNWDNSGGTCGFLYEQTYTTVLACHSTAVVTAAFIVSDSGWLSAPYLNWIDNIQYNDQTISLPPDNANP